MQKSINKFESNTWTVWKLIKGSCVFYVRKLLDYRLDTNNKSALRFSLMRCEFEPRSFQLKNSKINGIIRYKSDSSCLTLLVERSPAVEVDPEKFIRITGDSVFYILFSRCRNLHSSNRKNSPELENRRLWQNYRPTASKERQSSGPLRRRRQHQVSLKVAKERNQIC